MATRTLETKARDVHEKLLPALWYLECYRSEREGNVLKILEPECQELYCCDPTLVVIAVGKNQLTPGRTASFFNAAKNRIVLSTYVGHPVEAFEADSTIYFRVPAQAIRERQAVHG